MEPWLIVLIFLFLFAGCKQSNQSKQQGPMLISYGQMPAITKDENQNLHLVYGTGDSIMYCFSNNKGVSFSPTVLVDTLKELVAYATRGPQIAATKERVVIIAVNKSGNIFCYKKDKEDNWIRTVKVNDADTTNKEGFLGLAGNDKNLFAIWTDLRNDHHNEIFGARSTDGGTSWQKNILVYASPDSTICECCKPSVVIKDEEVFVMFRNWLNGNRDLYVTQSLNGGETFGEALKQGNGSWSLNGCPMDGGNLVVNDKGLLQTVWRRKSKIYSYQKGKEEEELGEGRGCNIETINGKNIYAWSENGNIVCLLPGGTQKIVGKGILPLLKSVSENQVLCVWENDKKIESYVLHL